MAHVFSKIVFTTEFEIWESRKNNKFLGGIIFLGEKGGKVGVSPPFLSDF